MYKQIEQGEAKLTETRLRYGNPWLAINWASIIVALGSCSVWKMGASGYIIV